MTALLTLSCTGSPDAGIVPAADKLTFLFFYTDG
jgi:hypothetical protein